MSGRYFFDPRLGSLKLLKLLLELPPMAIISFDPEGASGDLYEFFAQLDFLPFPQRFSLRLTSLFCSSVMTDYSFHENDGSGADIRPSLHSFSPGRSVVTFFFISLKSCLGQSFLWGKRCGSFHR
jgi:hypothetical protein